MHSDTFLPRDDMHSADYACRCKMSVRPSVTRRYSVETAKISSFFHRRVYNVLVFHTKPSKRLYFLKQLKRAGVPQNQLLHFYTAVTAHSSNTLHGLASHHQPHSGSAAIESIQKQAIHIIYNITRGMSYPNVLFVAELESLQRNNQSRSFFQDICKPTSCLYHLIPPPRDTSVITRLRPTTPLPKPSLRTKKYCSLTLVFTRA